MRTRENNYTKSKTKRNLKDLILSLTINFLMTELIWNYSQTL